MNKNEVYYAGFFPDKGGYSVLFPDFLGCTSQGENLEEAFLLAHEALEGHMECMADDDDVLPIPSTQKNALEKLKNYYTELDLGGFPVDTLLLPIKAPLLDTRTKQIAVSFSKYKLDMIDKKAKAVGMTRSGFLASAASAYDVKKEQEFA